MQYRIKVIEYESGRKEYVPQVRRWWGWKSLRPPTESIDLVVSEIEFLRYRTPIKHKTSIKSVTYKPVKP